MRNRIPHAVVMTVLCLLLLAPWLTGVAFKHNYYHLIDLINQDNRIKIDILEFHEGWLESTARIRVTLTGSSMANLSQLNLANPISFDIDETMFHGPVIYDSNNKIIELGYAKINSTLHLSEAAETKLLGKFQSLGIMQIDTLAQLDGNWRGHLRIPVLSLNIQNIGQLGWSGLDGYFKLDIRDDRIKHINVHIQIGSFTMKGGTQNPFIRHIAIDPSEYDYMSTHENLGLWSGNTNLHSNGLNIVTQGGAYFSMTDFNINTKFGVSADTFYNTNMGVNIATIHSTNTIVPVINDLHVLVSADNFSAQNLATYINFFRNKTPQAINAVDINMIERLLVHTIRTTSEIYSEISMKTSLGALSVTSKSRWKEKAPAPETFNDVTVNSETDMNISASASLVEKLLTIYTDKKHATEKLAISTARPSVEAVNESTKDPLNQQLGQDLKQGLITIEEFVDILNLEKEHPSAADFKRKLTALNLPENINSQLGNIYQSYIGKQPAQESVVSQKKPQETPQQLIQDLLRIGYIQKDKEGNYTTILTIENGLIKINGSVINLNSKPEEPSSAQ